MASITRHLPGEPEPTDETPDDRPVALAPPDDIEIVPDPPLSGGELTHIPKTVTHVEPGQNHSARARRGSLRTRLVIGDAVALTAVWGGSALAYKANDPGTYLAFGAIAVIVTLAAIQRQGLYRSRVCSMRSLEALRVVTASAAGTAAFILCWGLAGHRSLVVPVMTGAAAVAVVLAVRWRFNRWLLARRSNSRFLRTVIMVGTNEDADSLWTLLSEEPELGYTVGGVAGASKPDAPWRSLPNCTQVDRFKELAGEVGANGVIVVASALSPSDRREIVGEALGAGLHVQVWPGLDGFSSRRTHMAPLSGVPLLYVEQKKVAAWQLGAKRGMDLVLGSLLVVLTAPITAAAALAVKLTDGGPVIYRSERIGRSGTTIQVLKLRTMVQEADGAKMMVDVAQLNERTGGPLFKATHDPRVTKVGRILRATSIDELPQLWNVLNGTMSLVGPRPALVHEVEQFDPELRRRHDMRPGITGLWQVDARDNPSFSAYRRLDLAYIDDWSIGLDLAILASTVHELVVRAGKTLVHSAADHNAALSTAMEVSDTATPSVAGTELGNQPV